MVAVIHEQTWGLLAEALGEFRYTRDAPPKRWREDDLPGCEVLHNSERFRLLADESSNYAVLYIYTLNPNTYRPKELRHTRHEFVVPVATYSASAWARWVFDRIASIEHHETCESFQVRDETRCEPDCKCVVCGHLRTDHDGRDSSCGGHDECVGHRFRCEDGHYFRPYAPHHGNGEDPYVFWPGGTAEQKAKAPGDD